MFHNLTTVHMNHNVKKKGALGSFWLHKTTISLFLTSAVHNINNHTHKHTHPHTHTQVLRKSTKQNKNMAVYMPCGLSTDNTVE